MARTETLANMLDRCKRRVHMENSNFVSNEEWYEYINEGLSDLHDRLVKADPERFIREQTLTGDGRTSDFSTSSDYYGTYSVEYISDSSQGVYCPIKRLLGDEITVVPTTPASRPSGYTFVYNNSAPETDLVRIIPTPDSSTTLRHRYVVCAQSFATDGTDSAEVINGINGWEEYIIVYAGINARTKEESSTVTLERKLERLQARLEEMAENRSVADAGHVIDVRNRESIAGLDPASVRNISRA